MKNQNNNSKTISLLGLLFVFTLFFGACSKQLKFENSTLVPAARGDVSVKKDQNNNYRIRLNISFLAEPERLQPSKKYYVVWLLSEKNQIPMNIGQIVGTSKLHSRFETVSSSKPNRILVTAEDNASTTFPSETIVLQTNKF